MLRIQKAYGIPDQIVETIGKIYENAGVISPDLEAELIDILAGVLQGDTLSPYFFVIVLDIALRLESDGREKELGFHLDIGGRSA